VTFLVAALAAVACIAIGAKHGYDFTVLLLGRGHIPARNAQLFAACAWLAGALVLILGSGLLLRLMYRINGTEVPALAEPVPERRVWRGPPKDGSGRRR
jgi:hypothetical protein